ncbi:MAG TPA: hypothetical protein VFS67_05900 [Polyangiaceae bacterium]|nr:hypothetical protein [Polyangiaceae bacterium]
MTLKSQFVLSFVLASSAACARAPLPCRSPEHCPAESECLAHRCAALGLDPVAPGTTRMVLEATQVAVVRPQVRGKSSGTGPPPTVTFGGPDPSDEQLLVRFPRSWAGRDVEAAFLLLEPADSADPTGADVQLQVGLAGAAWTAGTLDQAPPVRSPRSAGLARTRPPSLLRLDVTAQLKVLQGRERDDHGLLVRADGLAGALPPSLPHHGATYSTGTDGELPRLDVYFRLQR